MKRTDEILLIKSPFMQAVSENDKAIIWHSLFGFPQIISTETMMFLNMFKSSRTLRSIYEEYEVDEEARKIIRKLIRNYFLIPQNLDERKLLDEKTRFIENSF